MYISNVRFEVNVQFQINVHFQINVQFQINVHFWIIVQFHFVFKDEKGQVLQKNPTGKSPPPTYGEALLLPGQVYNSENPNIFH